MLQPHASGTVSSTTESPLIKDNLLNVSTCVLLEGRGGHTVSNSSVSLGRFLLQRRAIQLLFKSSSLGRCGCVRAPCVQMRNQGCDGQGTCPRSQLLQWELMIRGLEMGVGEVGVGQDSGRAALRGLPAT